MKSKNYIEVNIDKDFAQIVLLILLGLVSLILVSLLAHWFLMLTYYQNGYDEGVKDCADTIFQTVKYNVDVHGQVSISNQTDTLTLYKEQCPEWCDWKANLKFFTGGNIVFGNITEVQR